ncbi:hypothetical protein RJ639_008792 [Escallonia herrerae]|uniref:Uncharacterized protein n=1 Tax=Escallonia herrerae TaxID=1293975 RepID=A0AA89ASJ2_9ASTE|nr:hypothetical protein RJ639_008792 [Escallonia herrerae]
MMNQDLIKLDQFDGSNFGRLQDKVKFLLMALKIVYILNCEPLSEPSDNASENEKKECQRKNDDKTAILHQVHELQDITNKICELDGKLSESFQVGMIIAKLPPSWKDYRKKLLHREKKFTLEKIQKHLHIEEESRNRDKKGEAEFNSKVNYVDATSGNSFHALQVKKEDNMFKRNTNHNKNKKKSKCHDCGKKGHYA